MSMEQTLKLYPSGFWGRGDITLSLPPTVGQVARRMMRRQVDNVAPDITYSLEVDTLAQKFGEITAPFANQELRDEVTKLAMRMFNGLGVTRDHTLFDFVQMQRKLGRFSNYHYDWCVETIKYIYLGKPRIYQTTVWQQLLLEDAVLATGTAGGEAEMAELFRICKPAGPIDMFQRWLTAPSGTVDLMHSLRLLYGRR